MTRSNGRSERRSTFSVEPLEQRRLLSFYTGPSTIRPVITSSGLFQIAVSGGGYEKVRQISRGVYEIVLFGTTSASTVTVTQSQTRLHAVAAPLQIGRITVKSGSLGSIDALNTADLVGRISPIRGSISSLQFDAIGPSATIDVGGLGGLNVAGNVALGSNGHVHVSGNLTGPIAVGGQLLLDGGQFTIGGDSPGAISLGSLTVQHGGLLSIQRDFTGGLNVSGDVTLDTGGNVVVGREAQNFTINGNLNVLPAGGAISVGGDLTNLTVNGVFAGKGTSVADLNVGLNLNNLNVLGGGADQGGLQHVNINVVKDVLGINIPHGVFNSFISAGVLIDGGQGAGIGPDGADGVFDSDIRAGVEINHLVINGNVRSDYVTNPHPTGYRTRIVAGEDRSGNFSSGGTIDNFRITGALIDSVVAASVKPNGGNGKLPNLSYGAPPPVASNTPGDFGFDTYDAPHGVIIGGTVGNPIAYQNYTELNYYNETLTGVAYDPADPTIDDAILPGTINPSFASAPVPATALATPSTVLPLPKQSTVLGGVISTPHGDNADYAGIFAADTRGVFIGQLPS